MTKYWFEAALVAAVSFCIAAPASAAVIVITQAKANAGGVTPGDAAGFPVTLSLPGAYRFDTNLTVPAGKPGILVTSHNVDIDMNGFRLYGGAGANNGVVSAFGVSRIHHGIISNFRFDGIFLTGAGGNSNAWVVENMQIVQNGDDGVDAFASAYSRFLNNSIVVNGGSGIGGGPYGHVEGNTIADNGSIGVVLESGGTVLGNSIFSNDSFGIYGSISTGYGNNTLQGNNAGGDQVFGGTPLQPNACLPSC